MPKEIKKSWTILEVKIEEWRVKRRVCFFCCSSFGRWQDEATTPPKFNMEPENDGFQEEPLFLGGFLYLLFRFHVKFCGVYILGCGLKDFFCFHPLGWRDDPI